MRSEEPQHERFHLLKKLLANRNLALLVGGLIVVIMFVTLSNKGLIRRFILEHEVATTEESISEIKEDIRELERRKQVLETSLFEIEKVAREQHGMKKPNEIVYIIKDESED